jgi:hypothetical protein
VRRAGPDRRALAAVRRRGRAAAGAGRDRGTARARGAARRGLTPGGGAGRRRVGGVRPARQGPGDARLRTAHAAGHGARPGGERRGADHNRSGAYEADLSGDHDRLRAARRTWPPRSRPRTGPR